MKHIRPLLFLLFSLSFSSLCLATPVAYTNVAVTCKEFVPNIDTENLTVTVDPMLNGGTITAGNKATDDCFFSISGNAISSPFTAGDYNFTSPLDITCWKVGFCVTGSSLMTLNISPVAGGSLFTLVASSITTTFVLPDGTPGGGGGGVVPEPGSLLLMGSGLTILGLVSRKRIDRT